MTAQHQTPQQVAASGRAVTPSTNTNPQRAPEQGLTRFERDFRRIFGDTRK